MPWGGYKKKRISDFKFSKEYDATKAFCWRGEHTPSMWKFLGQGLNPWPEPQQWCHVLNPLYHKGTPQIVFVLSFDNVICILPQWKNIKLIIKMTIINVNAHTSTITSGAMYILTNWFLKQTRNWDISIWAINKINFRLTGLYRTSHLPLHNWGPRECL